MALMGVMDPEFGLVGLGGEPPGCRVVMLGSIDMEVEEPCLRAVLGLEPVPVEVGPPMRLDELIAVRDRLRPERAHPTHHAGQAGRERGEVTRGAVMPAEPQVAGRPVEGWQMRRNRGVGDDRT